MADRWLLWRNDPLLPRATLAEYLMTLCHETGLTIEESDSNCGCLTHRARRTKVAEANIAEWKQQVATADAKAEEALRQFNDVAGELTRLQNIIRQF